MILAAIFASLVHRTTISRAIDGAYPAIATVDSDNADLAVHVLRIQRTRDRVVKRSATDSFASYEERIVGFSL